MIPGQLTNFSVFKILVTNLPFIPLNLCPCCLFRIEIPQDTEYLFLKACVDVEYSRTTKATKGFKSNSDTNNKFQLLMLKAKVFTREALILYKAGTTV